jgi:uncharacterized membrane protein
VCVRQARTKLNCGVKYGTAKGAAPLYGWAPPKPTMLEPILIVGTVIAATAWYVQHKWRKRLRTMAVRDPREGTVLELLARRYARGEIDREEYLQKRSDILDYPGVANRS